MNKIFLVLLFPVIVNAQCLQVDCKAVVTTNQTSLNTTATNGIAWSVVHGNATIINPFAQSTPVNLTDTGLYIFKLTSQGLTAFDTVIYQANLCDSIVTKRMVSYFNTPDSSFTVQQRIVYDTSWAFFNRKDSTVTFTTDTVLVACAPPVQDTLYYSIFSNQVPPNVSENDNLSVELGVRFKTNVDGYITGIRFYKNTKNTGTHIGELYYNSGVRLASETFTNETASGWQTLTFKIPIAVTAGTLYVASYLAPKGYYPANGDNFFNKQLVSGPITAITGVYKYSTSPAFPISVYKNSNYWIDIIFKK